MNSVVNLTEVRMRRRCGMKGTTPLSAGPAYISRTPSDRTTLENIQEIRGKTLSANNAEIESM